MSEAEHQAKRIKHLSLQSCAKISSFKANRGKMVFRHPASAVSTCPLQLEAKMVAVAGFKIQTHELCGRHANSHKPQMYLPHLGQCWRAIVVTNERKFIFLAAEVSQCPWF